MTVTILVLAVIAAANAVVGGLIGICGIAGFLLPMLYTGGLGFSVDEALALSFLAFLVSGILGSWNYRRAGNLDIPMAVKLGLGSLAGAILGVFLQAMIAKETAKAILYLVVLFSGISILVRMYGDRKKASAAAAENAADTGDGNNDAGFLRQIWFLPVLGFLTGCICSLSGAGGPVLVMPLLVAFGVSARIAVGVALLDSVFIAVPACVGYLGRLDAGAWLLVMAVIVLSHGIGVLTGSRLAGRVPVTGLKIFVAVASVAVSIYMLAVM